MLKVEYIGLIDLYGKLLTENQQELLSLYYGCDLSLSEIAEQKGVSRQSVSESLTKSRKQLREYEEKLGFEQLVGSFNDRYSRLAASVAGWAEEQDLPSPAREKLAAILKQETANGII